jgi:hypothetical protein
MGSNAITNIKNRIFADFLMHSRLGEFEKFLRCALEHEYRTYSLLQFWRMTEGGKKLPPGKILLLRHDVDTDVATAERMWEIENSISIKSTYFFRLSTFNIQLMKRIEDAGSEASYHYEELSTICKRDRIRSPQEVQNRLHDIRDLFARNVTQLRERTGLPMRSVASHGDFINRRLGIRNVVILQDMDFRRKVDIDVEAYDESTMKLVDSRHSDQPYPTFWIPSDPTLAIKNHVRVVYILVHPRHWRTAIKENLADDIRRLYEQMRYSI